MDNADEFKNYEAEGGVDDDDDVDEFGTIRRRKPRL